MSESAESAAKTRNAYLASDAADAPAAGAAYTAWHFGYGVEQGDSLLAYDEGEGDRSLEFWRAVHWPCFVRELAELGIEATRDSPVVCERFEVVYRPPAEGTSELK